MGDDGAKMTLKQGGHQCSPNRIYRKGKRHWRVILVLTSVTLLFYYVVYYAEDGLRNFILSVRVNTDLFFVPPATDSTMPVNCAALIQGHKSEIRKARRVTSIKPYLSVPWTNQSCDSFKKSNGYILDISKEEEEFPIAFDILTYKNIHQTERLLRTIYRPNNVYCIHVDRKSEAMFEEMRRLVACFDNVFLSSRRVDVKWGTFSVLEADLVCMEDLLNHPRWRYFINLTGQEFPLKTNKQLVQILKSYNGANDVYGTLTRYNENIRRFWFAGSPPHDITPVIGSVHIAANRAFVNYTINNHVARDLRTWLRETEIPDETLFPTLNFNPHLHIPGAFKGDPAVKPFLTRFKNWDHGLWLNKDDCRGKYQREICVFGVGDISDLVKQKHLFANKFEDNFQPAALDCMEEWYYNMTKDENSVITEFNTTFYQRLNFVRNHV